MYVCVYVLYPLAIGKQGICYNVYILDQFSRYLSLCSFHFISLSLFTSLFLFLSVPISYQIYKIYI